MTPEKGATAPAGPVKDTSHIAARLIGAMAGGRHKGPFVAALALLVVAILALVFLPFAAGEAINTVSAPDGTTATLNRWVLVGLIAGAVYIVTSFFANRMVARLATDATCALQTGLSDHLQTLSLSFFDSRPIGELISNVTNDVEAIARFFETAVAQLLRAVLQVVIIAVIMLVVDWRLAIAALLVVPVMLAFTTIIERVSGPAFARLQDHMGNLSGFYEETLTGHKVIAANRRQDWAREANTAHSNDVFDVGSRAFFASLLQFPIATTMSMLQIVIVVVVGAFLVVGGMAEVGVIVAFIGYAGLLSSPLSEIANLSGTMLQAIAAGRRYYAIMDEQPTIVDAPDAKPYDFRGGHVQFTDVDFSYVPGRRVLKHNTFEAKPGEMIGICGPTGAGKSTIINILTRYYDIDSGTILIDGQDLATLTQESLRRQIGTVLQEAFLFSDTVMNNLMYARDGATEEDCIAAAKRANAHDFIMGLADGYDTLMTERGANLSQGQRQMITIARAMVADPKMLILDEATSNVDTRTERLIQEGLQRLMAGRTSFVIAHRLSTIRPAARILAVDAGEIVEIGSHDELMERKGFYYGLYMSQFKGKAPVAT
jgi:ABC-type multidrug transport system fused ATPase/permease subunit